ncbi:hypothetical protein [Frigidibacter sp. ROC022]|uniref:hypothetical protein n=1 Tax=Frigidibacter sp. ROC022 TaxID=2971796 RepID=UPI00215A807B|nr:hypothetical protein [Frigidibacter sp. ROC022]MCR8724825.1 hypothetical protein [Frigidibacter sp. ROC022]
MHRLIRLLPLALLLNACDSPSPAVARWDRATIRAGGMTFGVHWNGRRAEAYRTSKHLYPHLSEVMANAVVAIEQVSGCRVRPGSLGGDAAIVTAALVCPAAVAAAG